MKHFAVFLLILSLSACEWTGLTISLQLPGRGQRRNDPSLARNGIGSKDGYPFSSADTSLFFSAVGEGLSGRTIYLFKDWEEVLALPESAVVSAEDGMHHIVDGHLVTECFDGTGTVICFDGDETVRLPEKELLLGFLMKGGDAYTLTRPLGGSGFVLRKNGNVLVIKDNAYVFGDMTDQSYGETGALYSDEGRNCFAYRRSDGRYFVVRDGVETEFFPPETVSYVYDIKVADGKVAAAMGRFNYSDWENARLWYDGKTFIQTGDVSSGGSGSISASGRFDASYSQLLGRKGAEIYYNPVTGPCGVWQDKSGGTAILRYKVPAFEPDGEYKWFNPSCGKVLDEGMLVALNPKDGSSSPSVFWKGRLWSVFWLDGEITGLTVKFSHTR